MRNAIRAVFLLSVLWANPVSAQESLYYILDGSGSMWGRVEGKMKIQIAKDVMTRLIDETPASMQAALMVYGHRRKADCSDIEELVSLGAIDKESLGGALRKITPKGKTPISDSISLAVRKLAHIEDGATVVLVSDGIETCEKDPCAVTKALKESGAKFVAHVVGFDVADAAEKQLTCIAEEGGGKYYSAGNADDLIRSLKAIQKHVQEPKAEEPLVEVKAEVDTPETAPAPIEQALSASTSSIRIKAKGPGRIRPVFDSWLNPPKRYRLIDPETGEVKAEFSGDLGEQLAPPGVYQVVWRQKEHGAGDVVLGEVVTVKSRSTSELPLKTGIRLVLPTWVKQPKYWGIKEIGGEDFLGKWSDTGPQLVPPGRYELWWRQSEHRAEETFLQLVELSPDVLNDVEVRTALNLVRAPWVPEQIQYWGLKSLDSEEWVAKFFRSFDPQFVPAGTYRLIYRLIEHGATESDLGVVEVKDGELNEFSLNTGVRLIPQPGVEPPYRIEFIELDEQGQELRTVRESRRFDPMLLKPGRYRITYWQKEHGSKQFTLVEEFELPKGRLVEVEL